VIDPALEAKMHDLLAKASVVAEAPAAKIDSEKTSSGKSGSKILHSAGLTMHERMATRFAKVETDEEAESAIAWADHQLKREIEPDARPLTEQQRNYWIVVHTQGRGYRDVAIEYGLNEKTVWKLRKEAGYEPRYGYPKGSEQAKKKAA
jgi:hypothetical protein